MAYDWKGEADKVPPKMPRGTNAATIMRVLDGGKGGKFRSRNNDPQIMVVFGADSGAQCAQMYTLSDKASWTLAKLVSRCGIDPMELTRQGIEPKHFANTSIAEEWLKGKKLWIHVEYETTEDGKTYSRVEPLTAEEANAAPSEPMNARAPQRRREPVAVGADPFADGDQPPPPDDDDIPF
jgi:hypothetical protein